METKITTRKLLEKIREQKTKRTPFNKDNFSMHNGYLTYSVWQHDLTHLFHEHKEYGRNSIVIARYKYGQSNMPCKRKDIVKELMENWTVEGLIKALMENGNKSPIELASEKNPIWWQKLEIMHSAKRNCEYLKHHGITYDEYIKRKKAEWKKQRAEKEVD